MSEEEFKTGQDVIQEHQQTGAAIAGFNRRVYGHTYTEAFHYENERQDGEMHGGWDLADKMISDGKIFYIHNFHESHECPNGHAFQHGGTFVCNTCNTDHLDKEWWKIKVCPDDNAWCCHGTGFVDIQESNNCAYGDTREEAIKNYGDLMAV